MEPDRLTLLGANSTRMKRGTVGGDACNPERCLQLMRTLLVLFLLSTAALLSTLLAGG